MAQICALNLNKLYQKTCNSKSVIGFTTVQHNVNGNKIKTHAVHAAPLIVARYYSTRKEFTCRPLQYSDYMFTFIGNIMEQKQTQGVDLLKEFRRSMRDTAVVSVPLLEILLEEQSQTVFAQPHSSVLGQVLDLYKLLHKAELPSSNYSPYSSETPLMLYTCVKNYLTRNMGPRSGLNKKEGCIQVQSHEWNQ